MISNYLIKIRERLSEKSDFTQHRQIIVLAGEGTWQKHVLGKVLLGHENNSLWVSDEFFDLLPSVSIKKAKNLLGNEKRVVIFDANEKFDPDSFAAISGVVVGSGFFFLLLPSLNKWNEVYDSNFGQRMLQSIYSVPELIIIKKDSEVIDFCINKKVVKKPKNFSSPFLSLDQQLAVEQIVEQFSNNKDRNTLVLTSDRGRGKSATLGLAVVRLMQAGIKNIAITAPRRRAADIVFKHVAENMPNATIEKGKIKTDKSFIQFYAPDDLIHNNISAEILLVDEAASIPIPILTTFLNKYPQCVFSTTVHGYEGTGRGFALRFYNILDKKNTNLIKLKLTSPVRWAENDPLESWMFNLLCLNAELADIHKNTNFEQVKIKHEILTKEKLIDNPTLLKHVFALLVLAHYRTQPSDLQKILDDDNLSIYITLYDDDVIAVALIVSEGGFSNSLSNLVYQGERRPAGHLLAQTLTYHCGVEYAATLNYARIMRIAVHPVLQQQGVGTSLLEYVIMNEKNNGRDAIGASFGMNEKLLKFWSNLNFNVVRIGFTREQTSGEHAAIMFLPFTPSGEKVNQEAFERFSGNAPYLFDDVLKDIPRNIKKSLNLNITRSDVLSEIDKKDLHAFNMYSRNYELNISALNKFTKEREFEIKKLSKNLQHVLEKKILQKESWKTIANDLNLDGQKEARALFQKAISCL